MACCHVAHDCELADRIIMGNNVLLAGHVKVERQANISGGAAAHHFVTIGAFAYVGGMTRMVQDVAPFVILEGHPSRVRGINVIGLLLFASNTIMSTACPPKQLISCSTRS